MTAPAKRLLLSLLLVLLCLATIGCDGNSSNPGGHQTPTAIVLPKPTLPPGVQFPTLAELASRFPRLHLLEVHGAPIFDQSSGVPLSYYHGPVMHTSTSYAIFWEPPRLQDGTLTHVNPTYNSLIERYLRDIGGSSLYKVTTQYYDQKGHITNSSALGGVWVDHSSYPASACRDVYTPHGCLSDVQIQAEVTKAMRINKWTASLTHLFFVFTAWGEGSCYDSANCAFSLYCAYHSYY